MDAPLLREIRQPEGWRIQIFFLILCCQTGAGGLFLAALWHHALPWQSGSRLLSAGAGTEMNINPKCCPIKP